MTVSNSSDSKQHAAASAELQKSLAWVRPIVRQQSAYQVADARGLIKLDAMENPYPLPDELKAELHKKLAQADLNRYPDHSAS